MERTVLSVIRADERADDGHEHRHLNADQPREVAVYLLIGGVESLIDLRLYFTEPVVDLFEPSVHLILQRHEPVVDLLEPSMHLILQPGSAPRRSDPLMACASTLASSAATRSSSVGMSVSRLAGP